jgi:hypothetical protein
MYVFTANGAQTHALYCILQKNGAKPATMKFGQLCVGFPFRPAFCPFVSKEALRTITLEFETFLVTLL